MEFFIFLLVRYFSKKKVHKNRMIISVNLSKLINACKKPIKV